MAGLESLTGNDPAGSESPILGDNRIRELTQKTKESISKEHTLSGIHAFLSGNAASRPAAGNAGRFYVLVESGVAKELQYDTGSSWESITKNQDIINQIANFTTHKNSNPMDHINGSIRRDHLETGILVKKHFGTTFANNNDSVVNLINGSELSSSWHTHQPIVFVSNGRPTFLNTITTLAYGSSVLDAPAIQQTKPLSENDIPAGAVAVILEATGSISLAEIFVPKIYYPEIKIRGRLASGVNSEWMLLTGGSLGSLGTGNNGVYAMGWRGQGTFPITTVVSLSAHHKIDYMVNDFNGIDGETGWEIKLVGYI